MNKESKQRNQLIPDSLYKERGNKRVWRINPC